MDRDLLKRAWPVRGYRFDRMREGKYPVFPRGYLPLLGVTTTGGWVCTHADESLSSWTKSAWGASQGAVLHLDCDINSQVFHTFGISREEAHELIARGDLLPNVDPLDRATWAWLLFDLVRAAIQAEGGEGLVQVSANGLVLRPHRGDRWIVEDSEGTICSFHVDTTDPAEALVHARIQLREHKEIES